MHIINYNKNKSSIPAQRLLTLLLSVGLFAPSISRAQWNGIGISGGTGSNIIDDAANWNPLINGAFSTAGAQTLIFGTDGGSLGTSGAPLTFTLSAAPSTQTFTINGVAGGSAETVFLGGITTAAGSQQNLTFGSDVTVNLGSAVRVLDLGNSASLVTINGPVTGTGGGFILGGAATGRLSLTNAANSFTGAITVNSGGELLFNSIGDYGANSSLGTGGTNAVVALIRNSTATFTGAGSAQSSNRNFTLSAGTLTTESNSTITNTNSTANRGLTLTGNITATPSTVVGALPSFLRLSGGATAQTNTFSGVFSDGDNANGNIYGLKKEGANATWIVSNVANTYSGATIVTAGVLQITKLSNGGIASSIGDSSNAATNLQLGGGTLRYAGSGDSTNRLFDLTASSTLQSSGTGAVNFTNSGSYTASGTASARTLTLGGTNTGNNTLGGVIVDSGTGANITSVTKVDAGKWILTGISTYTGATTVSGGTLVVDGTLGATNISVGSGASFGGDGSVGGAISFSGTSNLLFSTTATLDVAGTVSFTGSFGIANLSGLTNAVSDGTYTLLGGSGSVSASLLNNIGVGNAFDLGLGKRAYFDLGGDNLNVVVSAIPEPSSFAALAGLSVLALVAARRRR